MSEKAVQRRQRVLAYHRSVDEIDAAITLLPIARIGDNVRLEPVLEVVAGDTHRAEDWGHGQRRSERINKRRAFLPPELVLRSTIIVQHLQQSRHQHRRHRRIAQALDSRIEQLLVLFPVRIEESEKLEAKVQVVDEAALQAY